MWHIFWLSLFCIIESICGLCTFFGCSFNGRAYLIDSEIEIGCFLFKCTHSSGSSDAWQFVDINGRCPQCCITNDPHFYTFDGHDYDFHDICNYTISQPIPCCDVYSSYFPPYGIFGDFKVCVFGIPGSKCLDLTTYKISDDLSILIKDAPTPTLEINGSPLTVSSIPTSYHDCLSPTSSVIIWQTGSCINIVGTYYTISACYEHLVIYTVTDNINNIAGLCGYYSGFGAIDDEFQLRDCSSLAITRFVNEIPFGNNWKTIDQGENECRGCNSSTITTIPPFCHEIEEKQVCEAVINEAKGNCLGGYTEKDVSRVIEDCIEDCCSTGIENCERWAKVGFNFLCHLSVLANVTRRIEA